MIWTIAFKELSHLRNSALGLLLLLFFQLALPFPVFWSQSNSNIFLNGQANLNLFFAQMPLFLMVFVPALAMRTWAGERQMHTFELLCTYPLRPASLVLGKFLGNYLLLALCILASLPIPILVSRMGQLDWGPVLGGYVGALLLAASCLAICQCVGFFASTQLVAFVLSFALLMVLTFLPSPAFNLQFRFFAVARGVIDLADLLFYLGLTSVCLALNLAFLKR